MIVIFTKIFIQLAKILFFDGINVLQSNNIAKKHKKATGWPLFGLIFMLSICNPSDLPRRTPASRSSLQGALLSKPVLETDFLLPIRHISTV